MTTIAEYPIDTEDLEQKINSLGVSEHDFGNGKYKRMNVNYGNDRFVFVPKNPLKTFGVSKYEDNASGKPSYSISFELDNLEDRELEQYLKEVHQAFCKLAFDNQAELGMKWRNIASAEDSIKPILSEKMDKTGTLRKRFFAKLKEIPSKGDRKQKMLTVFEDVEGNTVNWEEIIGIRSKMTPAIVFEGLYCGGGKCSIQTKVEQVVVTETMGYEKIDYGKFLRK
jgi:hypothetical protein